MFVNFGPGVPQGDRAVEDGALRGRILDIHAEIAQAFELDDGSTVDLKGDEEIEYDGEVHTAANLFDALKEGYYGKF